MIYVGRFDLSYRQGMQYSVETIFHGTRDKLTVCAIGNFTFILFLIELLMLISVQSSNVSLLIKLPSNGIHIWFVSANTWIYCRRIAA